MPNVATIAIAGLAMLATSAHGATTTIGPVEPYLMDRGAEIALARSAAPAPISGNAEIRVLGRHGFQTAVSGKNGFVCLVERSWTSAAEADFWNPKVRTPICWNGPAARTVLRRNIKRTELILSGRTPPQVEEVIIAAVAKKELPAPEPQAMCYMMSKGGHGGDTVKHWPPHLMFYVPEIDPIVWGAGQPNSPVAAFTDPREHMTIFVIEVQRWSDGRKLL